MVETLEDLIGTNPEQIKQNYQLTKGVNPDQATKDFHVSKVTGLSPALVQNQRAEAYVKADQTNTLTQLIGNPGATRFMSNRQNLAMSKDDVDNLVRVATMSDWERIQHQFDSGVKDLGRNVASSVRALFEFQLAYSARVRASKTVPQEFSPADQKLWREANIQVTESVGDVEGRAIADWAESVEKSKALRVDELPRRPGMAGYLDDVVRMAPQIAAQIGVSMVSGPSGGVAFMGSQIAGGKFRKLVDQDGVEKGRAAISAFTDALLQALLEQTGLSKALSAWVPGKILSNRVIKVMEAMGTELITEMIQKYPEAITDTWAQAEKKGTTAQEQVDIFIKNFWDVTADGIYEGLVAAPFGGLTSSSGIAFEAFQKRKTADSMGEEYHDQQVEANQQVNETKLKGRSEEKTQEFLEEQGFDQDTFLTAEGVEVLFQNGNTEALEKLGIEELAIPEIQTTGVNTALRLSVLHSTLSPEEFALVAEHITPGKDVPSMAQVNQSRDEFAESMEAQIEDIKSQRQTDTDFQRERDEILQEVKATRLATGRVTKTAEADAQAWAAFAATYADKHGFTPMEVFRSFVPEVRAAKFEGSEEQAQIQGKLLQQGLGTIDDVKKSWESKGVQETLSEGNGVINLSKIQVDKDARKQGVGTQAMDELVAYADQTGQKVTLTPSKEFGASSVNRLKKFYKRFGFVENKGKNRDFEISEDMYREPTTEALLQRAESNDPGHAVAEEVNVSNPGNDVRYDGFMDLSALNRSDLHQFTAREGVAKGATFSSEVLEAEAVGVKLDSMIEAREGAALLQGVDQTQTAAFKEWFGDSKVVNENGNPLVVFHGTDADFTEFDPDRIGANFGLDEFGFFFSSSEDSANRSRPSYPDKPRYKFSDEDTANAEGGRILPAYVVIERPLTPKDIPGWAHTGGLSPINLFDQNRGVVAEALKTSEADGVIIKAEGETLVVPLKPTQIKSATENQGTFDPSEPNIFLQDKEQADPFFSALEKSVENIKQKTAPGPQWANMLNKLPLKKEELEWTGVLDWLKGQKGKVSKESILEFIQANNVEVVEVTKQGTELDREDLLDQLVGVERAKWDTSFDEEEGGFLLHDPNGEVRHDSFGNLEVFDTTEDALGDIENEYRELIANADMTADDMVRELGQAPTEFGPTKFEAYQLPGGENYKELLLTMPSDTAERAQLAALDREGPLSPADQQRYDELQASTRGDKAFTSSHFDEGNILAHVRFNERTDSEGNKVLFLEEVQSDWHQEGRKRGYQTPIVGSELVAVKQRDGYFEIRTKEGVFVTNITGSKDLTEETALSDARRRVIVKLGDKTKGVPDAPFKKSWPLLAMKRMIRYAAENGFDKVAWTTGEQQASRYDLSKQVDFIKVTLEKPEGEAPFRTVFVTFSNNDDLMLFVNEEGKITHSNPDQGFTDKGLDEVLGKEVADKIVGTTENTKLEGEDLKVGGEGMKSFYDKMIPSAVNKFFKKYGTKVETLELPQVDTYVNSLEITPELAKVATEQGLPLFQAKKQKTVLGSFTADANIIKMFEQADPSTFLHESSHAFFNFMSRNALDPRAPQTMKDDWAAIAEHVGNDGKTPLTTDQHEELARSLEAYFMEGKAPSSKLRQAFQNFATWLKSLYQNVASLDVNLNDDLRAMFDRMFATDAEIAEVQVYYDAQAPYFKDIEKEESKTYNALRNKAELDSKSRRLKKYTDAYIAAVGGEAQLNKDALKILNKVPVYASMDQAVADKGFPVEVVDYILGEDSRKLLSKKRVGLVTKRGEANPDEIAANNGYDNAEIMLVQMLDAESKTAAKDKMAIAKLEEIQRDMMDHVENDVVAEDEYHSDARMKVLAAELQMIQKRTNLEKGREKATATRLQTQAVRAVAKETLLKKTVKEATAYTKYSRAEAKAAKESQAAFRKDDLEKAEALKRQELLNHALVIESVKIRDEVDKAVKLVKRKAKSKTMHQDALDLVKDIEIRFGFKNRPPRTTHQEAVDIYRAWINEPDARGNPRKEIDYDSWEASQKESGYGVSLSQVVKNQGNTTFYKDMTIDSFRSVIDSVKQISEIDLNNRKVLFEGKKIDLDEAVDMLTEQLDKTFESKPTKFFEKSKGWAERLRNWRSMIDASMLKMEFLFENIDGQKIGVWHEMLFQRVAAAEEAEAVQSIQADKDIKAIFDKNYTRKQQKEMFSTSRVPIPEINESMTRAQLVRVFLDFGNTDNYNKRRDGHGWDDAQMNAVKDKLDKRDVEFAQDIWGYIETFKEASFNLESRMTGRKPVAVLPTPIETKFGIFKGGYFPISFDASKANITQSRQDIEQATLYGTPNYTHAMTKHGHLEQRQATAGGQVLSGELTDITKHVTGVIHDITHRESVVDVSKIFRDKRMEAVMRDKLGEDITKQMMPWLKDIANTDPIQSLMERLAKGLRIGTTVAKLGKFSVMLQQLAGFTQTTKVLGKDSYRVPRAFINMMKNPNQMTDEVMGKSDFMKTRISNYSREAHDAFKGLDVYKKAPQKLGEFAMRGIGVIQFMTDLPTWHASYETSLSADPNEKKAIAFADSVVRKSQGGGGAKDLARVQRGNEYFRLATMFYSFMNVAYQHFANTGRGKGFRFGDLSNSILFIGFLGPIAAELLSGRPPEEDENWLAWMAMLEARFYTGLFPVFRDVAGSAASGFGFRLSPIEQPIETVIKGVRKAVVKQEITPLIKPAAEIGGVAFRMPSDQMYRTSEAFWHWLSGDPDFEIQHLIYGGKYK